MRDNNKRDNKETRSSKCTTKGWRGKIQPKNDPFWYAQDARQISNMASFPWNDIHGTHIGNTADTVPGVVVYPWSPAINTAFAGGNYCKSAADVYFQYLTQGFTGNIDDFEAADLLMSALATNIAHAYLIEGRRVYGLMSYFVQYNSYYAENMVTALGFDYDDWKSNLANFREAYNLRVAEINKVLVCPKGFSIGDRWEFLSSYIFCDDPNPEMATAYCYRMDNALQYDGFSLTTGTALKYVQIPENRTVAQYFEIFDQLIAPLIDEDVRKMNGALRRVYSEGSLRYATPIEAGYVTSPVHYDVVCTALHNAVTFDAILSHPEPTEDNTFCELEGYPIYQEDGDIKCRVFGLTKGGTVGQSYLRNDERYILDVWDGHTDPGYVLDATVHMTPPTGIGATNVAIYEKVDGKEIYLAQRIVPRTELLRHPIVYAKSPTNASALMQYDIQQVRSNVAPVQWDAMCRISHLDNHPFLFIGMEGDTVTVGPASAKTISALLYMGDIHEYTTISAYDLIKMHNSAMFTLMSMPENTKGLTK